MTPSAYHRPNRTMLRRALFLLTVCGIVAFIVLGMQLFRLQILRHTELETAALEQQLRRTSVTAGRGAIYDCRGNVLAMSASAWSVYVSPGEIAMYGEDPEAIADALHEILGADREDILSRIADRSAWYKTVARQVSDEQVSLLRQFKNENNIQGIKIEPAVRRIYPYSTLASHVIGFVGADNIGLAGLEFTRNKDLTGTDGSILRLKNSVGTDMLFSQYEDYVNAENGLDAHLTLDANIQYFLEKHLAQAVEDFDIRNGAAGILMDPDTGAILAMASLGNFDLNHYQWVAEDILSEIRAVPDPEERKSLLSAAQLRQWRNKAISDTYEPGSTFKILTLSMALEEGIASESSRFFCPGSMNVPGRGKPLRCWKHAGHGSQTLTEAVQHSCNVAFSTLGLRVGEETFYRYCEDFGFFEGSEDPDAPLTGRTGIELPGESGSIWWSRRVFCNSDNLSQLAAASFGQTFNITPLQLITAVSACCNGGKLMQPYLVGSLTDENGTVVERHDPVMIRRVLSETTSRQVNRILEQVVCDTAQGTGKNAYVAGYRVAGKTGTSEKVAQDAAGGAKEYIVSFIGYAPADDPKVICLILMDTPSNETGIYISGGQMAAPVVGKVLGDVLPYLGVEPVYTREEQEYLDRAVPDVTGLPRAQAAGELRAAGLNCSFRGEGESVTAQLPGAGTVVAAGSTVILATQEGRTSAEEALMPEIVGLSYARARDVLAERGLFLRADGPILADSDAVRVIFQSVDAGAALPAGSVIEATLCNNDDDTFGLY